MIRIAYAATLGGALVLAGCASSGSDLEVAATDNPVPETVLVAPPSDLTGTVIRAATLDGDVVNRVHFYPNGVIHIVPESGDVAIPGTYEVANNQLCLNWAPRGIECWPYTRAFQMNETVTLTSDRGQMARVTMLDDDAGLAAAVLAPAPTATPAQTAAPMQTQPAYQQPTQMAQRAGERG